MTKQFRIEIFEEVSNGNQNSIFLRRPKERRIFAVVLDEKDMDLGDVMLTIVRGVGCLNKEVLNGETPD